MIKTKGDPVLKRFRVKGLSLLLSILLLILPVTAVEGFAAESQSVRMKVAFISPSESNFWKMVTEFMQAVANSLDIDLTVHLDKAENRYSYRKLAESVLKQADKPDYLMIISREQVISRMLEAAESAGVNVLTFNNDVPLSDQTAVGVPRQKLKHWIGNLSPDNVGAGARLAAGLVAAARTKSLFAADGTLPLIALSATRDSTASLDRETGLYYAIAGLPLKLLQLVNADWDRGIAETKTAALLGRHPEARAIWSASDGMALGAIAAARRLDREPGKDLLIGGVDWEDGALDAIERGDLALSLGRHFMDGGLGLLLLQEYHNGYDFGDPSSRSLHYAYESATLENLDRIRLALRRDHWRKVDFRQFSRVFNTELRNAGAHSSTTPDQRMDWFMQALTRP